MEQWHQAQEASVATLAINQGIRKPRVTARKGIPSLRSWVGEAFCPRFYSLQLKIESLYPLETPAVVLEYCMEIDTLRLLLSLKESLVDLHRSRIGIVFFALLNKKILNEDKHSNPSWMLLREQSGTNSSCLSHPHLCSSGGNYGSRIKAASEESKQTNKEPTAYRNKLIWGLNLRTDWLQLFLVVFCFVFILPPFLSKGVSKIKCFKLP